jgi:hypothetical protein
VRRAEQLAVQVVSPAVQRAYDVLGAAAPIEHDRLTVTADVRQQLDLVRLIAYQHAAFLFGRQRKIIPASGTINSCPM